MAEGVDEEVQRVLERKQAELQDLRDKRRAGKPVATQLRDIDARIKRKAEQLEKKDKALEALRSEREEVERKRAEIDKKEEEVVKEKEAARLLLESLQVQKAQLEKLAAPELQVEAQQRMRSNEALLREAVGLIAVLAGKLGETDNELADKVLRMRQQVVVNGLSTTPDAEGDVGMDADGQAGGGLGGGGPSSGNLEDDDYDSDDGVDYQTAVGLGITQQIIVASDGPPVVQTGEASAPPGEAGGRFQPF